MPAQMRFRHRLHACVHLLHVVQGKRVQLFLPLSAEITEHGPCFTWAWRF